MVKYVQFLGPSAFNFRDPALVAILYRKQHHGVFTDI